MPDKHQQLAPLALPTGRKLSRQETHDLGMIIKERTKVLKAYANEQAKVCMADFEKKLATIYKYDSDPVWKQVTEDAMEVIKKAQEKIEAQAAKKGIPKDLAPELVLAWAGRGQNAARERRTELRRVAQRECDAMMAAAVTKIEKQSLELRTQVVAMGLLTPEASQFLDSLAPVDEAMGELDFGKIEMKLIEQKNSTRRLGYGGLYDN